MSNERTKTYAKMVQDFVDLTVQARTVTNAGMIQSYVNFTIQLLCVITTIQSDKRYIVMGKLCGVKMAPVSHVIIFKTSSNKRKVSSVVQEGPLQIKCKFGRKP